MCVYCGNDDILPDFYVRKTWSYRCRIAFLVKENWHEIKDHGLVSVEMVCIKIGQKTNIEPRLLNLTDIINLKFVEDTKVSRME